MNKIEIIDFELFLNGSKEEQMTAAEQLVESFKNIGFIYLKNFGISDDLINEAFKAERNFFQLPTTIKESTRSKKNIWSGYYGIAEESLDNSKTFEMKEGLLFTNNDLSIWPTTEFSSDDKTNLLEFHQECNELANNVIKALAKGMKIKQEKFDFVLNNTGSSMRLNYYPSLSDSKTNQTRCGEHCDYGAVSLLFQDTVGGLEIKTRNNEWIQAPAVSNTVIINIGDCMERWTNGYLRSAPHRVVKPSNLMLERYSIVFFCDPIWDAKLDAFTEFENIKYTPKSVSSTYREYVVGKFNETRSL